MTAAAIIALIEGVIQAAPDAIQAYETLKAAVAARRDPTDAEWAAINEAVNAVHAQVQGG